MHLGDARRVLPRFLAAGWESSVKLCYLDPPFNTRGAHSTRGLYRDHRTTRGWADLMREVLQSVHSLLREDGSLWLHVDANELGTARVLCDELFGADNSAGIITWERTRRPAYVHGQMSSVTDFVLVYAKDRQKLPPLTEGFTRRGKRTPLAHRGNQSLNSPSRRIPSGSIAATEPTQRATTHLQALTRISPRTSLYPAAATRPGCI